MLIGNAGQVYPNASQVPPPAWNEKTLQVHGFAIVSAVNATHLYWELINSTSGKAIDRMLIIQPLTAHRFGRQRFDDEAPVFELELKPESAQSPIGGIICLVLLFCSVIVYSLSRYHRQQKSQHSYATVSSQIEHVVDLEISHVGQDQEQPGTGIPKLSLNRYMSYQTQVPTH
jgi:hypothetical protein